MLPKVLIIKANLPVKKMSLFSPRKRLYKAREQAQASMRHIPGDEPKRKGIPKEILSKERDQDHKSLWRKTLVIIILNSRMFFMKR